MTNYVLQLDASARINGSLTRELSAYTSQRLAPKEHIIHRDLNTTALSFVSEAHIGAYYTASDQRTEEQRQLLALSDELIAELKAVKHLVIGVPMYNFSVPAALKAWIDLICRVGETFVYSESGPKGLMQIEQATILVATGGTPVGSPADFVGPYLEKVCKFIGIKQSKVISVSGSKSEPEAIIQQAKQDVEQWLASIQKNDANKVA